MDHLNAHVQRLQRTRLVLPRNPHPVSREEGVLPTLSRQSRRSWTKRDGTQSARPNMAVSVRNAMDHGVRVNLWLTDGHYGNVGC